MVAKKKVTKKKTKKVTNSVVTVPNRGNDLAAFTELGLAEIAISDTDENWGAGAVLEEDSELYQNDYMIPKVWQMQALSEYLKTNKELNLGDFVSSLTGQLIGTPQDGIKFVVVSTCKKWQGFSVDSKGNREYERDYSGIMTTKNANWPYEEVIDGVNVVRRQVLSYYILLEQDFAAGTPQLYCLDFAGTSKPGGRQLVTSIRTNTSKTFDIKGKSMRLPSAAFVYKMTGHEESFAKGDAWVKDIELVGYSNKDVINRAKELSEFVKLNADRIEFDERDVISEAKSKDDNVDVSGMV